jgi:hypothetical protein
MPLEESRQSRSIGWIQEDGEVDDVQTQSRLLSEFRIGIGWGLLISTNARRNRANSRFGLSKRKHNERFNTIPFAHDPGTWDPRARSDAYMEQGGVADPNQNRSCAN